MEIKSCLNRLVLISNFLLFLSTQSLTFGSIIHISGHVSYLCLYSLLYHSSTFFLWQGFFNQRYHFKEAVTASKAHFLIIPLPPFGYSTFSKSILICFLSCAFSCYPFFIGNHISMTIGV